MFVGVSGPSGQKRCYVVPAKRTAALNVAPRRAGTDARGRGWTPPVAGCCRSASCRPRAPMNRPGAGWSPGPRHPARRCWRRRARHPRRRGYRRDHAGGRPCQPLYRPARLAPDIAGGATVIRGAVIGQTGRMADQASGARSRNWPSCCCKAAKPVDPMPYFGAATEALASDSIESLIGISSRVESAGNAAARIRARPPPTPGSSSKAPWLRMMRSLAPIWWSQPVAGRASGTAAGSRHLAPDGAQPCRGKQAYLDASAGAIRQGSFIWRISWGRREADMALRADPAQSRSRVMGARRVGRQPVPARLVHRPASGLGRTQDERRHPRSRAGGAGSRLGRDPRLHGRDGPPAPDAKG